MVLFFISGHFTLGSAVSGYHFIQMLNRPVDLPLRFIVICVVESITWTKTNWHQNTAVIL